MDWKVKVGPVFALQISERAFGFLFHPEGRRRDEGGRQVTGLPSVLCPAERSHVPDADLLPVDSVEDPFLMDPGSYDEVGVAYSLLKRQYAA